MQTAVVTGASSGIGKAICEFLLDKEYKVYGISRREPSFVSPSFTWIQADLTRADEYPKILQAIKDNVDFLINNAGTAFEQDALDFTEESFSKMFDLNFKAPILMTKLLKSKLSDGLVVNISSVSDRLVGEEFALYCSSKAALNIYFDVVALEEKDLNVVSILPSYVDTPLLRKLYGNTQFDWEEPMKPEQIAQAVGRVIQDKTSIPSGAKIIAVNNKLLEDLHAPETLFGYNVDTDELHAL